MTGMEKNGHLTLLLFLFLENRNLNLVVFVVSFWAARK
jgi:hypothetical protein